MYQSAIATVGLALPDLSAMPSLAVLEGAGLRFRVEGAFHPDDIGRAIEGLLELLDQWAGDPDLEDNNDDELTGDEKGDPAWIEWTTAKPYQRKDAHSLATDNEDDEEDDHGEEDDPSGQCDEEGVNTNYHMIRFTGGASGPGCPIADPDVEHDGREVVGAEDDFMHHHVHGLTGPGCPISDPDDGRY